MNSWSELAELLSQLPIMEQVKTIKKQLDDIRPLSQEVEGRVMQKLRLEWNYHSNAIEGNKLTRGETYTFLMQGLTAKAKPYKDHQDIKGHNKGIDFLFDLVKDQRDLTEGDIRDLHKIILVEPYKNPALTPDGQETTRLIQLGKYKTQPNFPKTATGEIHYYAMPEETPILMQELVDWYNKARHNEKIHPSVLAAFVHHRFVEIHPFDDGNGRLGRMLMNLILIKRGYPPVIIKQEKRDEYYAVLSQADNKEYQPLVAFMAESLLDSMNLYLKAARGESIDDDADLDKEIALFKRSFEKEYRIKDKETLDSIVEKVLFPIYDLSIKHFIKLTDLFHSNEAIITIDGVILNRNANFKSAIRLNIFHNAIIDIKFRQFKKSLNAFDWLTQFKIEFMQTQYKLFIGSQEILSKLYDETFETYELQKVSDQWFKIAFEDLKKKVVEVNKI